MNVFSVFLVVIVVSGLLFLPSVVKAGNELKNKEAYILTQINDTVSVVENTVTDQKNDFFAVGKDGGTMYVTVNGQDGNYTHEETVLTDKTTSLNDMSEESIKRKNKPKDTNTSFFPVFLPMR